MQTVLSVAGFDPSSGAGVTADLLVFAAHGLFGTSCITSLTVQSTTGVRSSHAVDSALIAETLACLDEDLPPAGIKIGMLGTAKAVDAVAEFIELLHERRSTVQVVLDPVIRSSSGKDLLDASGVEALKSRLLPLADWVTPNLDELARLTGQTVTRREQMESAAETLREQTARLGSRRLHVLATGGHLDQPDDFLLCADGNRLWLPGEHVATTSTHGTGCALSSALLCRLVLGDDPVNAVEHAKRYVTEALRTAVPIGPGHGPLNHLASMRIK